jgi:hypothetical protein
LSAFKNISDSDVAIVPYVANKTYSGNLETPGVQFYDVSVGDSFYNIIVKQYYPNYISGSLSGVQERLQSRNYVSASSQQPSSSYVDYRNISYDVSSIGDRVQILSLPRSYYGEGIKPSNLGITLYIGGETSYPGSDDGYGNITVFDPNLNDVGAYVHLGNIFYSQGLVVITNGSYFIDPEVDDIFFSFNNTLTVYEQTYRLKIKQHDFNYSYNPTLLVSGSDGTLQSFATGSSFQPYITAVGLYSPDNQLMAVAKFGQPLPMSANTDFNINVKLDW